MSPDLLPAPTATARIRLRFYDLVFTVLNPGPSALLAPRQGRFREAVVAFPARAGGIAGEASLYMWTDDDTYMAWAREAFGWPVLRGQIALVGPVWEPLLVEGATGSARVEATGGVAAIQDVMVREHIAPPAQRSVWLTPRRVLHRAGLSGETREVFLARPTVRQGGRWHRATGQVSLDFKPPHPLHSITVADVDLELVDGLELVVGDDVDVV
jgi:hypothetical protein